MRLAICAGICVFLFLFAATTFPASESARERARELDFSERQIEEGRQLSMQRKLIYWSSTFVSLGFLGWLVFSGQARRLADRFDRWTGGRWPLTLLLVGAVCFLGERLLLFPLAVLGLEHWRAWGMTERPFLGWLADYGKAAAIAAGVGSVLLVGLYALMKWLPRWWWAAAAGLAAVVGVAFAYALPVWVDPLFNDFRPLRDPALRARIEALTAKAGVPVREVLVMDASRQGKHTNAYFTGFGSSRRIVLYDTLLQSHPPEEVESILAHEIGHWKHHHILLGIGLASLGALAAFFALACVLKWAVGRRPFHLRGPADPAGWPLVLLLALLAALLTAPVEMAVSRHFERQADRAALELSGDPDAFIAAERRLARDNKINLTPTPFSVWFFASHPSPTERIRMALEWKRRYP